MKERIQEALRRRHRKGDEGFTLIELLVVILIIAILAAVGIIALLAALNSGRKSAATTVLRNGLTSIRSEQTSAGTTDFRTIVNPNPSLADPTPEGVMRASDPDIDWVDGGTPPPAGQNAISISVDTADDDIVVLSTMSDNDRCYFARVHANPAAGDRSTQYDSAPAGSDCEADAAPGNWVNTTADGWNVDQ